MFSDMKRIFFIIFVISLTLGLQYFFSSRAIAREIPLTPTVITEGGKYDSTTNTLDMSATVWTGDQTKKIVWQFYYYTLDTKDMVRLGQNGRYSPYWRKEKIIQYPNGDHWIKTTATNLPKLPNNSSVWCFVPNVGYYDKDPNKEEINYAHGQEICMPRTPWVITLKPEIDIGSMSAVITMKGFITNSAGNKKVEAWFEYDFKDQGIPESLVEGDLQDVNIDDKNKKSLLFQEKQYVNFWDRRTDEHTKNNKFCYRACVRLVDEKFNNCGAEECFFPNTIFRVETLPMDINGNASIYKGKISFQSKVMPANCEFKIFSESDSGESGGILKQAEGVDSLTGIFSINDSSLNFKNSSYCYRAYCTVNGIKAKAINMTCNQERKNLFVLACGSEGCKACEKLNAAMKKYAQENNITMIDPLYDYNFSEIVLDNKEKVKFGYMDSGFGSYDFMSSKYCMEYNAKNGGKNDAIPYILLFKNGQNIPFIEIGNVGEEGLKEIINQYSR